MNRKIVKGIGSSTVAVALMSAALLHPAAARAGGFDLPDLGTEALGRGAAFVAKADSPLALYYNIAGMARQRGTRLLVDASLVLHDVAYTASGVYSGDPTDSRTPYAGQPYPTMHDGNQVSPLPFIGVTTDFGYFKKWTFGLAVYAPPGIGSHSYGTRTVVPTNTPGENTIAFQTTLPNGMVAPAPTRYDIASTNLIILQPTLGVAYSPIKYLDIGAAAQLIYANFDLVNANVAYQKGLCPTTDYAGCDAYGELKVQGVTGTGLFSLMAHPTAYIDLGATYRLHANIKADGTPAKVNGTYVSTGGAGVHAYSPAAAYIAVPDSPVSFSTRFPDWLRLAGRYVNRYADQTERFDVELDLTYENWASVQQDLIHSDDFQNPLNNSGTFTAYVPHFYKDTYGARLGGAYNYRITDLSRLTGRLGFYYDSASTNVNDTHLDFDTAEKYAFTAGLGYKYKGFTLNVAYAYIYSPTRIVTGSTLRAISAIDGSNYTATDPTITYGNGKYVFSTQMVSLGLTINFSEFKKPVLFAN